MPDDYTFGKALKKVREDKVMSTIELANKIGLTRQQVHHYEHDASLPRNLNDVIKIIYALECNDAQIIILLHWYDISCEKRRGNAKKRKVDCGQK